MRKLTDREGKWLKKATAEWTWLDLWDAKDLRALYYLQSIGRIEIMEGHGDLAIRNREAK